ncbi:hypothetical protein BDN72DRAFT_878700 [Pluteus cervinus]|uniref:Uncharacterized protein n=1 Tax=Pluteus cervinus TaxID=181527 RepID=A0ACD3AUM1_9AGAR|nr:hypothetical protein BDN72DRAFT_878700 [Pluteus cervinus]
MSFEEEGTDRVLEPLRFYDPHALHRSQIDDQISHLREQLRNLLLARNTLLPISTIPNEILSTIFLMSQLNYYRAYKVEMRPLLALTWVCHNWRTIALSAASLWTYIGKENLHWSAECLIRSKQAPLQVSLTFDDPSILDIGATILSQIHRFRKLQLNFGDPTESPFGAAERFENILTQPAPMLESFSLAYATVSTPLFSRVFPQLRTVHLSWVDITWGWGPNLLPFGNLTHLSITIPDRGIPVTNFLEALSPTLPNLENLQLIYVFTSSPSSHNTCTALPTPVCIPNIKSFILWCSKVSPMLEFFNSCRLGPFVTGRVDMMAGEGETVLNFLDVLRASEELERRSITSVQVNHRSAPNATLSIIFNQTQNVQDSFRFDFNHRLSWSEIIPIFPSLPVHNITTLTLRMPSLSMANWTQLFVTFTRLEELELEEESTVNSFIQFIISSTPDDFDGTRVMDTESIQLLPFKCLRKLTLARYLFEEESYPDYRAFCTALKVRRSIGLRLQQLWLREDRASRLDLLKEVVDEVKILDQPLLLF